MLASLALRPFRWLSGLIEWEGRRGGRLVIGDPRAVGTLAGGTMLALSVYFIGVGVGTGVGGTTRAAGSTTTSPGVPNTPTVSVAVQDTSTWWVDFSAFSGSGADTQDSIAVTVLRSGAADTLFHAVSGVQARDTVSDNADLKADTTYRVLGRQKGASGGWSVADTVSVINSVWPIRVNQPAGMTKITEWDGSTVTPPALWGNWFWYGTNGSVVSAADHPRGSTDDVLRLPWDNGSRCCVIEMDTFAAAVDTLYVSYWIKWASDFDISGGGQKNPGYFGLHPSGRSLDPDPEQMYVTRETNGALQFTVQNTNTQPCSTSANTWPAIGAWTHLEMLLVAESTSSANDGDVTIWIDGSSVCSNTSVNYAVTGVSRFDFSGMNWYNYRNATHTGDSEYDIAELYLSGK